LILPTKTTITKYPIIQFSRVNNEPLKSTYLLDITMFYISMPRVNVGGNIGQQTLKGEGSLENGSTTFRECG